MIHSPRQRKAESDIPVSPSLHSPIPEIFSTKKILFLNTTCNGSKFSEIPQIESDYCPRDEASRRLFHRSDDICDCDCASDGFWGCLRRNRQWFCKFFVLFLSVLLVALLFGSFFYNLSRSKVSVSETFLNSDVKKDWNSHYHNYPSLRRDSISKPEPGDENSPAEDGYPLSIYEIHPEYSGESNFHTAHYHPVNPTDNRKSVDVKPVFIQPLKTSKDDLRNSVIIISDERSPVRQKRALPTKIKDETDFFKKRTSLKDGGFFRYNGRTVFQPFSLTTPMHSTAFQSDESSLEYNELDEYFTDEFPSSDSYPSGNIEADKSNGNLEKTSKSVPEPDVTYFSVVSAGRGKQKEIYEYESKEKLKFYETSTTNGFLSKEYSDATSPNGNYGNAADTSKSVFTDDRLRNSHLSQKNRNRDSNDLDEDDVKLNFYDNSYYLSSEPSSMRTDVSDDTQHSDNLEGISLKEAVERRKDNRKYLFINSRVVGGSSDVKLPTGPDISRPPSVNAFESLKTSQQLSFTPSAASQLVFPYQMCLFANPLVGPGSSIRSVHGRTFPSRTQPLFSTFPVKDDGVKSISRYPAQQNFLTFSINNYANSPSRQQHQDQPYMNSFLNFPTQHQFLSNAPAPSTPPIFCTYLQPPLFQFPTVPGTADFSHAKCLDCEDDIFSFTPSAHKKFVPTGQVMHCSGDNISCRDGSTCIALRNWCDNQVHCPDASDESFCSCRERVAKDRLCDGYIDCPGGEDEVGCFDCPKSAFSCDSVTSPDSCIPLSKRCDGVRDCSSGNDETDCSALFFYIHSNNSYQVSQVDGFLHRNWKGDWFPVCVDIKDDEWAKEACSGELGYLPSEVEVNFAAVPDHYKGPFLIRNRGGTPFLQDHCKGHVTTHITCPSIKCGTRSESFNSPTFKNRLKRSGDEHSRSDDADVSVAIDFDSGNPKSEPNGKVVNSAGTGKSKREETGRVVGGRESEPRAWPWTIAIYKDGNFLCGGVILDEQWILTAAHCMERYWKHYYEVRGGMLRRFSFSPMEQIRAVIDVIVHENYDPTIMSNDLALLRLREPFHFNRWVRPACLPSLRGGISTFLSHPLPGTYCIAVGWGAMRERGSDADQLREVEVPILMRCKHKEDLAGAEICAGKVEGGKDTCQGDSGGPLLCKNVKTPSSWYVAGIVSHGEGCARPGEPGAYTRISLFLEWITSNANDFKLPSVKPLKFCPGFRCTSASRLCIPVKWVCNGLTDCLEAEDEKNCTSDIFYDQYFNRLDSKNFLRSSKLTNNSSVDVEQSSTPHWLEKISREKKPHIKPILNNFFETSGNTESNILGTHTDYSPNTEKTDQPEPFTYGHNFESEFTTTFHQTTEIPDQNLKSSKGIFAATATSGASLTATVPEEGEELHDQYFTENFADPATSDVTLGTVERDSYSVATDDPEAVSNVGTEEMLQTTYSSSASAHVSINASVGSNVKMESELTTKSLMPRNSGNDSNYYQCRHIVQSILKIYLCDGFQDCEDGSDEYNCSCADILKNRNSTLVCNGQKDCVDASDEMNCAECSENTFRCDSSGECLPLYERCNGIPKCPFQEDERNCFILSVNDEIKLDRDEEPLVEAEGLVLTYKNGTWSAACQENAEPLDGRLASQICLDLGWMSYDRFENVTLNTNCTALQVICSRELVTSISFYKMPGGGYFWPWNAFVYSDGKFMCSAVLLMSEWLITSSLCLNNIELGDNYLVAKLGSSEPTINHRHARDQRLIRIDAIRRVSPADVALLHLSQSVNQTRSIRPIGFPYLPEPDPEKDICVAVGDGSIFLRIVEQCSPTYLCYNRSVSKSSNCKSKPWMGVIVCQSRAGWYPSSTFAEEGGRCGFENSKFFAIQDNLNAIYSALGEEIERISEPNCTGFRCPEGLCIPLEKTCNGSPDCSSGKDEDFDACDTRKVNEECRPSELKCRNGLCISKVNFADGRDNCGDGSDEPGNATCVEYLRLTAPQRICDGKRNCFDKTDEDYNICGCDQYKFNCSSSGHCVPKDFVCDGENDCPGGEDEEICTGRKSLDNHKTKAFEIMQKSYGVWHDICPTVLSKQHSDALCQYLGFNESSLVYEKNQTVLVPQLDPFSVVKLNKVTSVILRSDQPFVRLVETTKTCKIVKCR